MRDLVGWCSSFVLLLTLGKQIHKQWADGTSKGVSIWLYIGQISANIGFSIYSGLLGNIVFLITNLLLLLSSMVGLGIVLMHRRRAARKKPADGLGARSPVESSAV